MRPAGVPECIGLTRRKAWSEPSSSAPKGRLRRRPPRDTRIQLLQSEHASVHQIKIGLTPSCGPIVILRATWPVRDKPAKPWSPP